MKKIFLVMMFALVAGVNIYAANGNDISAEDARACNTRVSTHSLVRYLDLTKEQTDSVMLVQNTFVEGLEMAQNMKGERRQQMLGNAINYNLNYMRFLLTREQYRKYLTILNQTLRNRGFNL